MEIKITVSVCVKCSTASSQKSFNSFFNFYFFDPQVLSICAGGYHDLFQKCCLIWCWVCGKREKLLWNSSSCAWHVGCCVLVLLLHQFLDGFIAGVTDVGGSLTGTSVYLPLSDELKGLFWILSLLFGTHCPVLHTDVLRYI